MPKSRNHSFTPGIFPLSAQIIALSWSDKNDISCLPRDPVCIKLNLHGASPVSSSTNAIILLIRASVPPERNRDAVTALIPPGIIDPTIRL